MISEEVVGGAEAEVGGGAGTVFHGPGERGDVAAGGGSGGGVPHGRALLVGAVGWGATTCEAAAGGAAAVVG